MEKICRHLIGILCAVACLGIGNFDSHAQNYPSRPVKAVTDVGTGGTYDIFVRALGDELNKRWGQGIVVEPHPGGNAVIGIDLDYEVLGQNNGMLMVSCSGTAVVC